MKVTQISCCNCAASSLVHVENSFYRCEYCGSTFIIETKPSGELHDAKVSGNMIDNHQIYAVHEKLLVKGNMNDVRILETASNAFHVNKLTVSGNMNNVSVVLLDGATTDVRGNMNDITR